MKQKFKYLIGVIVFILILVGVNLLYYRLKDIQEEKLQNNINNIAQGSKTELDEAKDFSIETEDGTKVKLSDFKEKPIIINFWASWCAPCKMEMTDFNKIYKEEKENIQFMMINVTVDDTKKNAQEYIRSNQFSFPVYYDIDGIAAYTYSITGYPTTYFINSNFEIMKRYNGMISEDLLRKYIQELKTI